MREHWGGWQLSPLLLPLVALVEILAQMWFSNRAPNFAEYEQLVAPVTQLHQPGDVLVVSPRWAEPMVRKALGSELLSIAAVAGPGVDAASGVLQVSLLGQRAEELAGMREVARRTQSPFVLTRWVQPKPPKVVVDFVQELGPEHTRVTLRTAGSLRPVRCMFNPLAGPVGGNLGGHPTWPQERYVCPGSLQMTVGRSVITDERWRPRRCVLAPPPAVGKLVVSYRAVQLGERIVGHGGLDWMTERSRGGAAIELQVEVDDAPIGSFIHADGDGWAGFEMQVPASSARARDVTFIVSSPATTPRAFCFEARSR